MNNKYDIVWTSQFKKDYKTPLRRSSLRILANYYVRPDEAQKVLSALREKGAYTVTDKVTVLLNVKKDRYEAEFTKEEWITILLRSTGMEATKLPARVQWFLLARMLPLVENNLNMCELGPRSTGKSHLFELFPDIHDASGDHNGWDTEPIAGLADGGVNIE